MDIVGTAGDDAMEYLAGPGIHIWVNLWGGTGNDIIRVAQVTALGEAGNDTIIGVQYDGAGMLPSAAYWNSPSGITANLAAGTVLDGFGTIDTLVNIRSIQDSRHDDLITGSALDDTIVLSRGNDTVIGGGGSDTVLLDVRSTEVVTRYDIASDSFILSKQAPYDHDTSMLSGVARISFFGPSSDYAAISVNGAAGTGVSYVGAGGRDIVHSGKGNDTIDGSGGLDTVVFDGNRAGYTVTRTEAGVTVNGALGQDTLTHVERAVFGDIGIAFDTDGAAGQAFRLYQAAFNRAPDAFGLGFWISRLDLGVSLQTVAGGFTSSKEFSDLYGGSSTADVVARLYANILQRPGDAEGVQFWTGVLEQHAATMAEVLAGFSESAENVAHTVGVMQDGLAYLPYV